MKWVTLHTVTYPQDAYVIKARLKSEGIRIFLKDEFTTQVHNFYPNATLEAYEERSPW